MKDIKQSKRAVFAVLSAVFLALTTALGLFLAVKNDFSPDIGHFVQGSPLFYVFVGSGVLSVGAAVLFALLTSPTDAPAVPSLAPLRAILGFCIGAVSLFLFAAGLMELPGATHTVPAIGSLVTLPGLALFFVLGGLPSGKGGKAHVLCGIVACLSVNLTLFKGYFDFTLPLNSPIRNALTVMEAAVLLFLFSEVRILLGRSTPRFRRFASLAAVSLGGGISLGLLLAMLFANASFPVGVDGPWCLLCLLTAVFAALGGDRV